MLDIICVTCSKPIQDDLISISHVSKWGTITRAIHKDCYEKDKIKWDENDWEIVKPIDY